LRIFRIKKRKQISQTGNDRALRGGANKRQRGPKKNLRIFSIGVSWKEGEKNSPSTPQRKGEHRREI